MGTFQGSLEEEASAQKTQRNQRTIQDAIARRSRRKMENGLRINICK